MAAEKKTDVPAGEEEWGKLAAQAYSIAELDYLGRKESEELLNCSKKLVEIKPDDSLGWYYSAFAYLSMSESYGTLDDKWESCIELYNTAVSEAAKRKKGEGSEHIMAQINMLHRRIDEKDMRIGWRHLLFAVVAGSFLLVIMYSPTGILGFAVAFVFTLIIASIMAYSMNKTRSRINSILYVEQ